MSTIADFGRKKAAPPMKTKGPETAPTQHADMKDSETPQDMDELSLCNHGDGTCSTSDGEEHGSIHEGMAHMAEKMGHKELADHIRAHESGEPAGMANDKYSDHAAMRVGM